MVFKDKDVKDLVGLKTNLTYTRFEDKLDLQSFGFEVENLRVNVIKKYLILFFLWERCLLETKFVTFSNHHLNYTLEI